MINYLFSEFYWFLVSTVSRKIFYINLICKMLTQLQFLKHQDLPEAWRMVSFGECSIYTKGKKINIFCCCCVGVSINVHESNWFILLLKSWTSILIFCLVVLCVIESGVLKSAISIVKLFSSWVCQLLLHIFLQVWVFHTYIFTGCAFYIISNFGLTYISFGA